MVKAARAGREECAQTATVLVRRLQHHGHGRIPHEVTSMVHAESDLREDADVPARRQLDERLT